MKRESVILVFLLFLVACAGAADATPDPSEKYEQPSSSSCTADEYKTQASAQMDRLQALVKGIELTETTAVSHQKQKANLILNDINSLSCRDAFPLKQETLEYSARHFIEALEHLESGDLEAMESSMNRMELNVNAFYDWSIDLE